jgi:hypothetical protein
MDDMSTKTKDQVGGSMGSYQVDGGSSGWRRWQRRHRRRPLAAASMEGRRASRRSACGWIGGCFCGGDQNGDRGTGGAVVRRRRRRRRRGARWWDPPWDPPSCCKGGGVVGKSAVVRWGRRHRGRAVVARSGGVRRGGARWRRRRRARGDRVEHVGRWWRSAWSRMVGMSRGRRHGRRAGRLTREAESPRLESFAYQLFSPLHTF